MGLIRDLLFGGLSGVGEAAATVGRVFVGDKAAEKAQHHDQTMAVMGQYASEFRRIENRTWWDALVDGLNRLPRPLLALGTVGLFAYAMIEPVGFAIRMQGLDLVPDELWYLLGAVVGFFFGARELAHSRDLRVSTADRKARVAAVVDNITQLQTLRTEVTPGVARMEDEAFRRALNDTTRPMSNAAILEWNQRRG